MIDQLSPPVLLVGAVAVMWHFAYVFAFILSILERFRMPVMEDGEAFRPFERMRSNLWWVEVHLAFPTLHVLWFAQNDSWLDWFFSAMNLWVWWDWYKHGDDDQWKRRRRKLATKLKEVGGKLVVVPAPST